jgi:hypothetical protein
MLCVEFMEQDAQESLSLDIRVYHTLMFEYFMAGHRLDERNAWLPPVRTNIREVIRGKLVSVVAIGFWMRHRKRPY